MSPHVMNFHQTLHWTYPAKANKTTSAGWELKEGALETLRLKNPSDTRLRIYTDGTVEPYIKSSGAGVISELFQNYKAVG